MTTEPLEHTVARLEAEVTILEAIAIAHLSPAERVMAQLRAEGVRIALDIIRTMHALEVAP